MEKGGIMKEIWKDIEGYEGYYQVSSLGRVKSLTRKDSLNRTRKGKVLKPFDDNNKGYLLVDLVKFGKSKTVKVHRLVANAFIPNPLNKPQVNHDDGDKKNNNAKNLEWATREENIQHSFNTGLVDRKGEKNSQSKLTEKDIRYIRENYQARHEVFGAKGLAEKFGVEKSRIYKIVKMENWKSVD